MSRKLKSTLRLKSKQGFAVGHPPLGYVYDKENPKKWIIDSDGAEIVRYIYSLRLEGESINKIAEKLKREKIPIASVYAKKKV